MHANRARHPVPIRYPSHAEFVVVEATDLTYGPVDVPGEQAGSLYVAGTTAYAAVRAVAGGTG
jgi:NADPH:quinone reductase-like Zn-dependent oxidoreductase